ncbi:hypothetical protein [Arthrobacter sp.]|uniref:hypothetical protein n=1 Tax=Arthrobacter sp. TaxID=1667 RepID=UPI0028127FFC|nr:hypothetical protein [Arthrobacter sp.]
MNIDKQQILDLLRNQGDQDKAQQAEQELPDQVDTERDSGLLEKFGLNPQELLGKLGGGGGLGGLLG